MPIFTGILAEANNQSFLNNDLLIKTVFADDGDGITGATEFLFDVKQFHEGQSIELDGSSGTSGNVSAIRFSSARSSGLGNLAFTAPALKKKQPKKAPAKKPAKKGAVAEIKKRLKDSKIPAAKGGKKKGNGEE